MMKTETTKPASGGLEVHEVRINIGWDEEASVVTPDDLRDQAGHWRELGGIIAPEDWLWQRELKMAERLLEDFAWIENHRPDLFALAPTIRGEIKRVSKASKNGGRWLSVPIREATRVDFARELEAITVRWEDGPPVGNIINTQVAAGRYRVAPYTLRHRVQKGLMTDHRPPGHKHTDEVLVDEVEVADRYPKR